MGRNLRTLILASLLGISGPSVANDSRRFDYYSTITELANLAMRCGQKVRREIRTQHNPSLRYIVDEYILEPHDGSGLYFRFRDGGYDIFGRGYIPPNKVIDDEDSVNYTLWDWSGYCTFRACRAGSYYFNERTMESVERLKRSVPPICLNPNIC